MRVGRMVEWVGVVGGGWRGGGEGGERGRGS